MRVGCRLSPDDISQIPQLVSAGFEFIELQALHHLEGMSLITFPLPLIWQCPGNLPSEHFHLTIRQAVFSVWKDHLQAAKQAGATLIVFQFRRPAEPPDKKQFIREQIQLWQEATEQAVRLGIQPVLRNSPDNRDQLQLLRELMREVPGLGLALDVAYAHHQTVKNLSREYLWDADLGPRLIHTCFSETNGQDANLRLPLGCLGKAGINWLRLVHDFKERYNASITIDTGNAPLQYLILSRDMLLDWWQRS